MVGTSAFLKDKNPSLLTVGVTRIKNNPVPGPRTQSLLREIAFDWEDACDAIVEVGTVESYRQSLTLARHGLLVGPSTGFSFAGLLGHLHDLEKTHSLDPLRNTEGLIHAVVIACDTPFPYLDDYFTYLPEEDFPEVLQKELLTKKTFVRSPELGDPEQYVVDIPAFIQKAYGMSIAEAKETPLEAWTCGSSVSILDIRWRHEFDDHHLPFAQHEDVAFPVSHPTMQTVFVLCSHDQASEHYVSFLRKKGVQAYYVQGGMIEWSKRDLSRIQAETCVYKRKNTLGME